MGDSTGGLILLTGRFPVRTLGRQVRTSSFSDTVLDGVCLVSYFLVAVTLVEFLAPQFFLLHAQFAVPVFRRVLSAFLVVLALPRLLGRFHG